MAVFVRNTMKNKKIMFNFVKILETVFYLCETNNSINNFNFN